MCTVAIGSTKSGFPASFRKWVFRFLQVPLQALSGALTGARFAAGFLQHSEKVREAQGVVSRRCYERGRQVR